MLCGSLSSARVRGQIASAEVWKEKKGNNRGLVDKGAADQLQVRKRKGGRSSNDARMSKRGAGRGHQSMQSSKVMRG